MKTLFATTLALGVLALAGCSHGPLDGTWGTQAENHIQLAFSGDHVTMTKDGQSITSKFRLDGTKILILPPDSAAKGSAPVQLHFDAKHCIRDPYDLITGAACKQ